MQKRGENADSQILSCTFLPGESILEGERRKDAWINRKSGGS